MSSPLPPIRAGQNIHRDRMRCAYCGEVKRWSVDFPVRSEACCSDCLPRPHVPWFARLRTHIFGRSKSVPSGGRDAAPTEGGRDGVEAP
jgi:hypothetical protein